MVSKQEFDVEVGLDFQCL